ncbi:MAG: ADP-ribosylglycohydrolase family protein [Phycisphaerae bacterium]
MRSPQALFVLAVILLCCQTARAEQTITADDYLDRVRGMWLGQILGNYAGRPVEGEDDDRGGLYHTIDWDDILTTATWDGDDDTCFEYMYASLLDATPDPGPGDLQSAWTTHIPSGSFYIANKQARLLMDRGYAPPDTGSHRYNMHWYAIDSQITTESIGALTPGMRQAASDLTRRFAEVTNTGYPVHAAQFYAALYAAAPLETDVEALVAKGAEVVPQASNSRTWQVVQDTIGWYETDKADGTLDWRSTQAALYDKYRIDDNGRYRFWIESTINTGLTVMALLYGEGDFKQTVDIGVNGGFDADCNPATAAGIIGLMQGYSGLPADLRDGATDAYSARLDGVADTTVGAIASLLQSAAEQQILAAGGSITGAGAARTYHLPDDLVTPPPESPEPTGPTGLVGEILALGGTVTTSASVENHQPDSDRRNLDAIIDGIRDQTLNGHLPYWTHDGDNPQPAGGDVYQLNFDRDVRFDSLIFYEGDILWDGINSDPAVTEPRGGYFLDLTVEVGNDGVFEEVTGLSLSEALDDLTFFQEIELTFDPVVGDAIRIRGTAGGTYEFTTIRELEAIGVVPEPGTLTVVLLGGLWLLGRNRCPRR